MILSSNWFTEPAFDFEYKKYQLLAYLQRKNAELQENKIYPHLDELTDHEYELFQFLKQKDEMDHRFKKDLEGFDEEGMELKYVSQVTEDEKISEITNLVQYSYRKMKKCRLTFTEHAWELQQQIRLELSGLLPTRLREGFLILFRKKEAKLFSYSTSSILNSAGNFRFHYALLEDYSSGKIISETSIRSEILKRYGKDFDHPPVFAVICEKDFPVYETVLPLTSLYLKKWMV